MGAAENMASIAGRHFNTKKKILTEAKQTNTIKKKKNLLGGLDEFYNWTSPGIAGLFEVLGKSSCRLMSFTEQGTVPKEKNLNEL